MRTRELHLSLNLNPACLTGTTNQYWGTAPLHSTWIGVDGSVTYDFTFTLNGKADVFFRQAAHMSQVISYLADDNDEIRAVSYERFAHVINIEAQLGTTA